MQRSQVTEAKAEVPVKAVQKAMALLDRIALEDVSRQGVSLSELAEEFNWPLNSTHNLLKTLMACGYIAQSARGVYMAGTKCDQIRRLGQCTDPGTLNRLLGKLQEFVDTHGEGCVCAILTQGRRVIVGRVDCTHAIRVSQARVENAPFFDLPTSRMLAATAGPEELRQILSRNGMPGKHWNSITDQAALAIELEKLRKQGWCLAEDTKKDLVGIAAPILESDGRAWGALGTFAPIYRCTPEKQEELRLALCRYAKDLSAIVGSA